MEVNKKAVEKTCISQWLFYSKNEMITSELVQEMIHF
jgi:hypothetical protein